RELAPAPPDPGGGRFGTAGTFAPPEIRLLSALAPGPNAKPPAPATGSQPAAPRHESLGAQFARSVGGGIDLTRAFVLAAAGLAILLLAAATLPDQLGPLSGLGMLLLRRRLEMTLGGAATLVPAAT